MSFYKNLSLFLINWLNCISCISRKIVTNLTFNYYFNPKTSFIVKTPVLPTIHSAAIIAPKAKPSRL